MAYLATRWLHEAPEDEDQAPTTEAPESSTEETPAEGDTETNDDTDDDDEDFDIDTSLDGDDEEEEGEEENNSDNNSSSGIQSTTSSSSNSKEPVEANTDIFPQLSAEEQQIKIGELKKLYKDLYNSTNDLLHRIDDMDLDEDIMNIMTKVSDILHHLQDSIADYFENMFDIRSYFENDVKYNEFLLVLKKTTTIVDDLANTREKIIGRDSTNSEDKNTNI